MTTAQWPEMEIGYADRQNSPCSIWRKNHQQTFKKDHNHKHKQYQHNTTSTVITCSSVKGQDNLNIIYISNNSECNITLPSKWQKSTLFCSSMLNLGWHTTNTQTSVDRTHYCMLCFVVILFSTACLAVLDMLLSLCVLPSNIVCLVHSVLWL